MHIKLAGSVRGSFRIAVKLKTMFPSSDLNTIPLCLRPLLLLLFFFFLAACSFVSSSLLFTGHQGPWKHYFVNKETTE